MRRICVTVALLALLAASAARAGTVIINWGDNHLSGFNGGPFKVTFPGGEFGGSFNTFCLEGGEYIDIGGKYLYEINTFAVHGNNGGQVNIGAPYGNVDYLSNEAAWLYQTWRNGTLWSTVGQGSGTPSDLKELQNVIWKFEGESVSLGTVGNALYNYVVNTAKPTSIGLVRVLNLYPWNAQGTIDYSSAKQSQLVLVPLPSAAWAGIGLLVLVVGNEVRRRVSRA